MDASKSAHVNDLTPLQEDTLIKLAADKSGMDVLAVPIIEIDDALLPSQYFRRVPDYAKVRRDLMDGVAVPGAALTTRVKYILVKAATGGGEHE